MTDERTGEGARDVYISVIIGPSYTLTFEPPEEASLPGWLSLSPFCQSCSTSSETALPACMRATW